MHFVALRVWQAQWASAPSCLRTRERTRLAGMGCCVNHVMARHLVRQPRISSSKPVQTPTTRRCGLVIGTWGGKVAARRVCQNGDSRLTRCEGGDCKAGSHFWENFHEQFLEQCRFSRALLDALGIEFGPKEPCMKITRQEQDTTAQRWVDWHILTVAESGFSMLDIYGRHQHGLDIEAIRQFADRINERDESGSLYPQAPISAVPHRFFREQRESIATSVLNDFRRHISEFLKANRTTIHASRILIDFHVSPAPVPRHYLDEVEEIVRIDGQDDSIDEVVIFI